jgi:3-oxoacyl-[acyl-carrier protein] reductase
MLVGVRNKQALNQRRPTLGSLAGRSAIVTGGSRGIGLAIATAFVREGAHVCITGRKKASLDEARGVLLGGAHVLTCAGNAGDEAHQAEVVDLVLERFGSLDVLVNNTGISPAYGPLIEADLEGVRKTFDTNVVAALAWAQLAHRQWMGEHGGAIVNIASVAGLRPSPNIGAYSASKAALIALTRQLAVELGPNIRVNAVAPAVVRTRFAQKLYEHDEEGVAARYPLQRLGRPEDVADAVLFLVSQREGWITGETIVVDGGVMHAGGV